MNKTVNINLAGIVFHINEDAFETLNNYLNSLKNHFKNEEGADEILKDIEGRIAELFTERLDKKEAISMIDVTEITGIMGNPSQYDDEIEPEDTQENKEDDLRKGKSRKVFRDEEGRMIEGVCSGLAHYFNINVLWSRIIFIFLLFIIGPGAPFIYIIFWIALPSAKTIAEKLEMKGEKVNINNIEKNIKDELDNLEKKVRDFDKKMTKEVFGSKFQIFMTKCVDFFISVITGIFKFIGSCFGIFAVLLGGIILVVLSTSLLTEGSFMLEVRQLFQYIFEEGVISSSLSTGIILFIGLPMVAVILFGLKLINNTTIHSNYKIGMLCLWFVSWFLLANSGTNIALEFKKEAKNTKVETIDFKSDTLYLSMDDIDRNFDNAFDAKGFKVTPFEQELIGIGMRLNIIKSNGSAVNLVKEATAFGKDKETAKRSAEGISFHFALENEDMIFDDFFSIEKQLWRMQELDLTLEIPIGKVIYLDHSMEDLIYDIKNQENMWDYDMLGHYWKMEKEGLTCINCR